MTLIYNATFDKNTRKLSFEDRDGTEVYSFTVPERVHIVDDPNKPLMLRAIANSSTVTLKKNGWLLNTYQTSTDGTNWTDYTLGTKISLNKGESVYFRCSNHPTEQREFEYVHFSMTGKIEAWHNAYSMISSDFSSAEGEVGIYGMNSLFSECKSLTKAPLLLNAISSYCYRCTFQNCSSLVRAPALPATTLEIGCYALMYEGCRSLKEVRIAATNTYAKDALDRWLDKVSVTGDFYCDPNTKFEYGASGCPSEWTKHNIADYPTT